MSGSTCQSLKAALRKEVHERILTIPMEERRKQSEAVTQKVLDSPFFKRSEKVCVYLSTPEEISTQRILKNIFLARKQCFVPRYTKEKMQMVSLHSMEDYDQLPETKWNIKQPKNVEGRLDAMDCGGLDLILVPGVAFTRTGDRLGHGKGYYDKFLSEHVKMFPQNPFVTIALAFSQQVLDNIPTTDKDFRISHIFQP